MRNTLLLAAVLAFLTACKLGPDYQRPTVETPVSWAGQPGTPDSWYDLAWWEFYRDPILARLIAVALEGNKDLRIAAARVEQARGSYVSTRSYLAPSVDASAGWTRARSGITDRTENQFDVFGLLSYEIDIWGRLRRLTEAARAQLLASEEGRRAVHIGLVNEVASTYFSLKALDEQLLISRRTYASRTNNLELTRAKFDDGNGVVSELDVFQAETQVYSALAAVAELQRGIAVTEHALSILLGRNPGPIARTPTSEQYGRDLDQVPAGLPSDLLLRRPDILAAEQQLVAANAQIGAARAAYFPKISLTGSLGLQSLELSDLFDAGASKAWSFAPQITGPIFNAGRIRAGVQVAEATKSEALAVYEQAIQNAFREVEDALVSIRWLREQLVAEQATSESERKRFDLSMLRYENGVTSYFEVLDAERSLFSAELSVVTTRRDLAVAVVTLYRALGGGWQSGDGAALSAGPAVGDPGGAGPDSPR